MRPGPSRSLSCPERPRNSTGTTAARTRASGRAGALYAALGDPRRPHGPGVVSGLRWPVRTRDKQPPSRLLLPEAGVGKPSGPAGTLRGWREHAAEGRGRGREASVTCRTPAAQAHGAAGSPVRLCWDPSYRRGPRCLVWVAPDDPKLRAPDSRGGAVEDRLRGGGGGLAGWRGLSAGPGEAAPLGCHGDPARRPGSSDGCKEGHTVTPGPSTGSRASPRSPASTTGAAAPDTVPLEPRAGPVGAGGGGTAALGARCPGGRWPARGGGRLPLGPPSVSQWGGGSGGQLPDVSLPCSLPVPPEWGGQRPGELRPGRLWEARPFQGSGLTSSQMWAERNIGEKLPPPIFLGGILSINS